MYFRLFRLLGLSLLVALLSACEQELAQEHRELNQDSGDFFDVKSPLEQLADEGDKDDNEDKNESELAVNVDSAFQPIDPSMLPRESTDSFPKLSFNLLGVPDTASDYYNFEFTVEADAAFSHYAYKIDSSETCDDTTGYTVNNIKSPLQASIGEMPDGPVFLCVIAFHFPTKTWQPPASAHVYSWEKLAFVRVFNSYYDSYDPLCFRRVRFQARINIQGDSGSYTWSQLREPGCLYDPRTFTDELSQIKLSKDVMTGVWHEGNIAAGWFEFKFSNSERSQFTGSWGYGQPGVKVEGVWNSN